MTRGRRLLLATILILTLAFGAGVWTVRALPSGVDLSVQNGVTANAGSFIAGTATGYNYTVTVTNFGTVQADSTIGEPIVVNLNIAGGAQITGGSGTNWTCVVNTTTSATCTLDVGNSIAANSGTSQFVIPISIDTNASPTITLTASVSNSDDNTFNNTGQGSTPVAGVPDLTITKILQNPPLVHNNEARFIISVRNKGSATATIQPVFVNDNAGSNNLITNWSGTNWNCTIQLGGQQLACQYNLQLLAGQTAPDITVYTNPTNPGPNATLPLTGNIATVFSVEEPAASTGDNSASAIGDIYRQPDLSVTKTASPDFVVGLGTRTFTITVTNNGGPTFSGANSITVVDTVPAGLTINSVTSADFPSCNTSGQTVTCVRTATLATSATATITITVTPTVVGTVTNTVTVNTAFDQVTGNNSFSLPVDVKGIDVAVTKDLTGDLAVGVNATYSITVANVSNTTFPGLGFRAATGTISLSDTVPAILLPVAGTFTFTGDMISWNCTLAGQMVSCTNTADLDVGQTGVISFTVRARNTGIGATNVTNTATATVTADQNTSNNTGSHTYAGPIAAPDLILSNTVVSQTPSPFVALDPNSRFTFTVENSSISNATATAGNPIILTFTFPSGVTAANVISSTGTSTIDFTGGCVFAAPTLTCTETAGNVRQADPETVEVEFTAPPIASNFPVTVTINGGFDPGTPADTKTYTFNISTADLLITKTHTGTFPRTVSRNIRITVRNIGAATSTGTITVTDTLPTGMRMYLGGTLPLLGAWTTSSPDGATAPVFTFSGTLAPNAESTFEFQAYATDLTPLGSVVNTVTVANAGEPSSLLGNNTATDTLIVEVEPTADLTVSHSCTPLTISTGQNTTCTITVTNIGLRATTGATMTLTTSFDTAGLTYVTNTNASGWSGGATLTPGVFEWTSTNVMATGDTAVFTLTLQGASVSSSAVYNLNSTIAIAATENNTANNSAQTGITVQPTPQSDLAVTMTHTGNFIVGSPGTYTIRVQNVSAVNYAGGLVEMTTNLPTQLAFASVGSAVGWTCAPFGGTNVQCTRSDALTAGSFYPDIVITVNVTTAGSYTPGASIVVSGIDGSALNNNATDPTIVTSGAAPDMQLVSESHVNPFTLGVQGVFTINVANIGSGPTTADVYVRKALPSGFSVVAGNSGSNFTCSQVSLLGVPTAECVRLSSSPIPASSGSLPITLQLIPSTAGTFPNTSVTVTTTGDANSANDSFIDPTNVIVNGVPDLVVSKTEQPAGDFTLSNGTGTYRITVTNVGSGSTSGTITVTDTLPSIMNFNSASGGVSCTGTSTVTCTFTNVIAPSGVFFFDLTVNLTGTGTVTNNVSVIGGGDTSSSSGSDTTTVNASPLPNLTVTKTEVPAGNFTISSGTGTYRITVENVGTVATDGSNIVVTDTLPGGMTYSSHSSPAGFTCTGTTTVTCQSNIVIGASTATFLDLTVSLSGVTPGTYTNNVSVQGGGDNSPATGSDTTTVVAGPSPDLTLSKSGPSSFAVGADGNYTITVTNIGTLPTTGTITVTDTIPVQLTYVSGSGTGGFTCTGTQTAGATVTCTTTTAIAVSGSATVTLTVSGNTQSSSGVINTATVSGGGDVTTSNNSGSTGAIPISGAPDLSITKSLPSGTTFLRQNVNGSFNLTIANGNGGPTSGTITVTDTLPTALQFISASGGGFSCSGAQTAGATVTCTRSTPMNANEVQTIIVNVLPVSNGFVTNTASVSGGGEPSTTLGNNTSSLLIEIRATNPAEPGTLSSYTLTPTSAPADNTTLVTLTITIYQLNNTTPAPNTTVTLQPNSSNGLTFSPGLTGTTNASGQVTFTIKSSIAQTVQIPYSATNSFGGPVTYNQNPPVVTFTTGTGTGVVSASKSTVVTDYISIPADGTFKATITVTLKNDADQPITGKTVTLTANPAPSTLIIEQATSNVSDSSGQVKFTVRSSAQGESVFSASVNDNPVVFINQTVTIKFTAPGTAAVAAPSTGTGTPEGGFLPAGPITGTVIAYRLRVRVCPSLDCEIIGLLKLNTRVSILAKNKRGTWLQIQLETGTAWVYAAWIRMKRAEFRTLPVIDDQLGTAPLVPIPSPLIPVEGQGIGVVNTYNLRVRTGPGFTYQKIGLVRLGTELLLLGISPDRKWYKIAIVGGEAWVSSFYVRVRSINGGRLPVVEPPPTPVLPVLPK